MELYTMRKTSEITGKNGLITHAIKTHKINNTNAFQIVKITQQKEYHQTRIRTLQQTKKETRKNH